MTDASVQDTSVQVYNQEPGTRNEYMENKSFNRILIKRGIIAAIALIAFAGISYLMTTNRISQFDDAIRFFIYDMRNPVLSAVLIPITYLGNL